MIDPGKLVYPKAVYVLGGSPGHSETPGLKAPGGGATTITATGLNSRGVSSPYSARPGLNVGGYVESASGLERHADQLGYSEILDYLSPKATPATGSRRVELLIRGLR